MLFIPHKKFFSFSRYLSFCFDFLVKQKNGLIRGITREKFMTSQPGKQTISIHILSNISLSKGSQTMKFGQSVEYNMRQIFLEKLYKKCGREIIPGAFTKKPKLSISLDQQSKVLYSLFLLYAKLRAIEIYRN